MKLAKRQTGISFFFMLILIGLFGYAIYIGIKLAPEYMEFLSVKSSVDSLAEEMKSRAITKKQAQSLLDNRLNVNYISLGELSMVPEGFGDAKAEAFYYKRNKLDTEVGIKYKKFVPMIANATVVLDFDYVANVPNK